MWAGSGAETDCSMWAGSEIGAGFDTDTAVPHLVQNLAPGFKTAPQAEQTVEAEAGPAAAAGWGVAEASL